ncbi:MAG: hypothetical protein QF662_02235, partial [Phycisphaerae bacterium]|nr:hypothetical protein [Phycisphaerae bacterium]
MRRNLIGMTLFVALLMLLLPSIASASIVVRLVKAEKPEELIDVGEVWQSLGFAFRVATWPTGAMIDGKTRFKRVYKGKRLFEKAQVELDMKDGVHTLWPGDHKFTVKGGKPSSTDPELVIKGNVVSLLCYPVTVYCPVGGLNLTLEGTGLLPRKAPKYHPLAIYLPTSANDKPYYLNIPGTRFHVTKAGVKFVGDVPEWAVEARKFIITVPMLSFRISGGGVTGAGADKAGVVTTPYQKEPLVYSSGGTLLKIRMDFDRFPVRYYSAAASRVMGMELPRRSATAGKKIIARVPFAPAFAGATVGVFFAVRTSAPDIPANAWQKADVKDTGN